MYIYAKAGERNEYLYGVNFTRIKYLQQPPVRPQIREF